MKTKTILVLAAFGSVLLAGCGPKPTMPMSVAAESVSVSAPPSAHQRIRVTRIGVFEDDLAYGSRRGVYTLTDTQTGKEYIGISGIGIQEVGSHASGKTTVSDER